MTESSRTFFKNIIQFVIRSKIPIFEHKWERATQFLPMPNSHFFGVQLSSYGGMVFKYFWGKLLIHARLNKSEFLKPFLVILSCYTPCSMYIQRRIYGNKNYESVLLKKPIIPNCTPMSINVYIFAHEQMGLIKEIQTKIVISQQLSIIDNTLLVISRNSVHLSGDMTMWPWIIIKIK